MNGGFGVGVVPGGSFGPHCGPGTLVVESSGSGPPLLVTGSGIGVRFSQELYPAWTTHRAVAVTRCVTQQAGLLDFESRFDMIDVRAS